MYEITLEFFPDKEFAYLRQNTSKNSSKSRRYQIEANAQVLIINPTRKENLTSQTREGTESFYQRRITIPLELLVVEDATGRRTEEARVAEFYTGPIRTEDEITKAALEYFSSRIGMNCSYREFSTRARMIGIEQEFITPAFKQMIEDIIRKAYSAEPGQKKSRKIERHLKLVR